MNALRSLGVEQQVALLFLILFGLLSLASIAVFVPTLRAQHSEQADPHLRQLRDLRALWIGTVVFWLSWMSGAGGRDAAVRCVLLPGAARVHHPGAHAA